MIRLTYASTANNERSPEELLSLLKTCRTNNGASNITGILLYARGTFFQVLEGDEATINNLYGVIEKDKRHRDVTLIEKQPITERAFPYWSMGFEKIDSKALSRMEGLNDFFEKDFTPSGFSSHRHVIGPLLAHLRSRPIKQVTIGSHEELPMEHEDSYMLVASYHTHRC